MQLVKNGIPWSVGGGRKIKMLDDNWIPDARPGSFRTLTPIPDVATVYFLLNADHRAWAVDIVCSIFEEEIINRVLQIPISQRGGEYYMSWPFTRFGEYSVVSGYNLARIEKFYIDRSRHGGGVSSITKCDGAYWKKNYGLQKLPAR
jgi:hypothetical protein